jgi:hypothetical protein
VAFLKCAESQVIIGCKFIVLKKIKAILGVFFYACMQIGIMGGLLGLAFFAVHLAL